MDSSFIYIGCTAKLLGALKIKKPQTVNDVSHSDLRMWHANFKYLDRRKIILFTHDLSCYSFLLAGVKKEEFDMLDRVFLDSAANMLLQDGFTEEQVVRLLPLDGEVTFGKSHNRSVTGVMNNFGRYMPFLFHRHGMVLDGAPLLNQFPLSRELNDTPVMCDKDGFFPRKRLRELVSDKAT